MGKRILSCVFGILCAALALAAVVPVYADETETIALGTSSAPYFVTIPKTITLGADQKQTYTIKVEGEIAPNQRVCVKPEARTFHMKDQSSASPKADVVAEVSPSEFSWSCDEVQKACAKTGSIVAQGLSAGKWQGTFQMKISLENVSAETASEPFSEETEETPAALLEAAEEKSVNETLAAANTAPVEEPSTTITEESSTTTIESTSTAAVEENASATQEESSTTTIESTSTAAVEESSAVSTSEESQSAEQTDSAAVSESVAKEEPQTAVSEPASSCGETAVPEADTAASDEKE